MRAAEERLPRIDSKEAKHEGGFVTGKSREAPPGIELGGLSCSGPVGHLRFRRGIIFITRGGCHGAQTEKRDQAQSSKATI